MNDIYTIKKHLHSCWGCVGYIRMMHTHTLLRFYIIFSMTHSQYHSCCHINSPGQRLAALWQLPLVMATYIIYIVTHNGIIPNVLTPMLSTPIGQSNYVNFQLCQFSLCLFIIQLQLCQFHTKSISQFVHFINIDKMGIDIAGIHVVGNQCSGNWCSGKLM